MSEDARWKNGLAVVEQVYGAGSSALMQGQDGNPFVSETVSHLFGEIWSRPGLSMRDKRLLVIGATAMLGRSDLVAIQVAGPMSSLRKFLCSCCFMPVRAIPPRCIRAS